MVDPTVVPTAGAVNTFFTNIVGTRNRYIWSVAETINEVRWIIDRNAKWWSDNLYRAIEIINGGAVINSQPGGVGTATTSTCRIMDGLGGDIRRYVRGWLGDAPFNTDTILPYKTEVLHGWTRIYDAPTGLQVIVELNYANGKIVDGTYHQYHATGEVYTDEIYTRGTLNGLFSSYYAPPVAPLTVHWRGNYTNGSPNGVWNEWSNLGVLIQTVTFTNGIRTA